MHSCSRTAAAISHKSDKSEQNFIILKISKLTTNLFNI